MILSKGSPANTKITLVSSTQKSIPKKNLRTKDKINDHTNIKSTD